MSDFITAFSPTFYHVMDLYKGLSQVGKLGPSLYNLEQGKKDVRYYELRAYADFIGLPTGLLLLFTHIVGEAHRKYDKDALVEKIELWKSSLENLKIYINNCGDSKDGLICDVEDSDLGLYQVVLDGLVAMASVGSQTEG